MKKLKIAIQNNELGQRGGIATYSNRLEKYLNGTKIKVGNQEIDVEAKQFVSRIRNGPDVISIQYEPGMLPPQALQSIIQRYSQPVVVTAHHMGILPQFYPLMDGIVVHSKNQLEGYDEPWNYTVIPHPALVFENKDKKELRKKYGLPEDKKILGTAGFIVGTGKELPMIIEKILRKMKDDEFLFCSTSFWKGGDFGHTEIIMKKVKELGKEDNFRIDTDFVPEEVLNEKMQCCDLLFAWNNLNAPGSNSGIAMDMLGARRKLIVKDSNHYGFVGSIKGVAKGRQGVDEFVTDIFKLFRSNRLDKDIPDPIPYSWETMTKKYAEYFYEILGE